MSLLNADQRLVALAALQGDFRLFASMILKILPKEGGAPVPLDFNAAQLHLHRRLGEIREKTGRVRALVLKGRQQGVSTYTEGRFYWRLSHAKGKRAMILTHEQAATDKLFAMVSRFHRSAPPEYRPALGASNAKELVFNLLDCSYSVATAGSKDTGRGGTAQFFHGSEIAFWPHATEHLSGIGQVVPDLEDTEVIYESTANGTANVFHELWQLASKGRSDFTPIFIPWMWQPEYVSVAGPDFDPTNDEQEYADAYGCTPQQMAWRRRKIDTDFRGDASRFDQEYPASAELAFLSSSPRALISAKLVAKARRARDVEAVGRKIMGVDPAEYGDDSTGVALRQGRVAEKVASWNGLGTMETVGKVGLLADRIKPDAIVVDATGVGTGVADRLIELGYPVIRVHFGQAAIDSDRYAIARDEMWGEMEEWFADEPASISDDDDLAAQLTSVQFGYDSKRRKRMESKEKMKDRGIKSPDDADALALTFWRGAATGKSSARQYREQRGYDQRTAA